MNRSFNIPDSPIALTSASDFIFKRLEFNDICLSETKKIAVQKSHEALSNLIEKRVPVYGVNTGFGDSLFRFIPLESSQELQKNLVRYLMCGTGRKLSPEATRATLLFRLVSISQGLSGVSLELIDRLKLFLERDWLPQIPCQGSLGASGDLVPLAYIAGAIQGLGTVLSPQGLKTAADLHREYSLTPYVLKPKEGLALVNGTSAMCGVSIVNLVEAQSILDLVTTGSAWLSLALGGRKEAFGPIVNSIAKKHSGQSRVAAEILEILESENHETTAFSNIGIQNHKTDELIQDRYSVRCVPQILGPILETLDLVEHWIEQEINGVSDNPLIDPSGNLATGGNFYGGYLSQGMDYVKICLGHIADLVDRQVTHIVDEKSNRGLPANLANWTGMPESERFLHHGLKGLHQSVNAITSEILARTVPNGMFSRSSESHNQDKVSLGMSAAISCEDMLGSLYHVVSMYLICLAQALDLRGVKLQGKSLSLYQLVRKHVPFVECDQPLGEQIEQLAITLKQNAHLGRMK